MPAPNLSPASAGGGISQEEWEAILERDELHTPEPEPPKSREELAAEEERRERAAVGALLHSVLSAFPPESERAAEYNTEEELRQRACTVGGDAPHPASPPPMRTDELREQAMFAARVAGDAAKSRRPAARSAWHRGVNIGPPPEEDVRRKRRFG